MRKRIERYLQAAKFVRCWSNTPLPATKIGNVYYYNAETDQVQQKFHAEMHHLITTFPRLTGLLVWFNLI